ncbi:hypothetical protein EI546_11505 [Aequorivita sp. H23M31]|uniref:Uncharacterized protein n=1 Tax=Aequorivita ciconiae TaxID=2494375 RepID=A0A410G4U3_9FLAO|nr:hypothetical protein [Aequorivita sp. H23M31]QAA82304.1 hypothetical protein EI546_11505 [Aequorivita sp. H23M31]
MIQKEQIEKLICDEATKAVSIFDAITKGQIVNSFKFDIDSKHFTEDFITHDITQDVNFKEMFDTLREYNDYPALYFFQINQELSKTEVLELIKVNDSLKTPAINNYKENNVFLYVGKVTSCAWGRLIQHLGYHKQRKSHGLQVGLWGNKTTKDLKLSFTVIFFEQESRDYLILLEKRLSKKLKPIIGKH